MIENNKYSISKIWKYHSSRILVILSTVFAFFVLFISIYSLYRFGISVHHDEWVGRGLYPGLAMGNGLDLYAPKTGPHVTLYGFGTALFYSVTALTSNPTEAVWLAYILNVAGFLVPIAFLLNQMLYSSITYFKMRIFAIIGSLIVILSVFAIEPTTEGVLRIHADLPALFFLLCGLCIFNKFVKEKKFKFLFITCIFLSFSVWAKLPTLTTTIFPIIYFIMEGKFKKILIYIPTLCSAMFLSFAIFSSFYGWEDTVFILFKHISSGTWSHRNHLFDGSNATFSQMNYIDAIPLVFRFLVMYVQEYWYIATVVLGTIFIFSNKITGNHILKNFSYLYLLSLPPGLVALARFGSVENSLLFANSCGLLILLFVLIYILSSLLKSHIFIFSIWFLALVLCLPFLRLSRSGPQNTNDSPHQQAFDYLKSGKKDVYFGWYPISHLMLERKNYTCIETPTWVGMTKPEAIDFSIKHFPKDAEYLATGPAGYGSTILRQYLGELEEVPAPPELSSWRLFRPIVFNLQ